MINKNRTMSKQGLWWNGWSGRIFGIFGTSKGRFLPSSDLKKPSKRPGNTRCWTRRLKRTYIQVPEPCAAAQTHLARPCNIKIFPPAVQSVGRQKEEWVDPCAAARTSLARSRGLPWVAGLIDLARGSLVFQLVCSFFARGCFWNVFWT
jgi:hypothetical protein